MPDETSIETSIETPIIAREMSDGREMPDDYVKTILGHTPTEVLTPATTEAARQIVETASQSQTPIIPWGSGTKQDYGYLPQKSGVLLHLSALNQILLHEPDDMIVAVEAGVTLADLQTTLAAKGQFLPLDPLYATQATIGGILATNSFGLSSLGYGTARDWLIGIKVIDAHGQWVKGGGKVVKNVTGYDLPKLHIGALGTLGIITEAIFKVAPLPEAEHTLLIRIHLTDEENPALATLIAEVRAQTQPVRAVLHSDSEGHYFVLGYAGPRESVEYQVKHVRGLIKQHLPQSPVGSFPEKLDRQEIPPGFAVRLQCLPDQSLEQHQHACYETRDIPGSVDTSLGGITEIFWESVPSSVLQASHRLRDIAGRTRASFTVLHAPAIYRANYDIWSPLPPAFPLMRRMKEQLDPNHRLNPGRFIGRL
jgi:glycolate oxidase FAD binding subunit